MQLILQFLSWFHNWWYSSWLQHLPHTWWLHQQLCGSFRNSCATSLQKCFMDITSTSPTFFTASTASYYARIAVEQTPKAEWHEQAMWRKPLEREIVSFRHRKSHPTQVYTTETCRNLERRTRIFRIISLTNNKIWFKYAKYGKLYQVGSWTTGQQWNKSNTRRGSGDCTCHGFTTLLQKIQGRHLCMNWCSQDMMTKWSKLYSPITESQFKPN